MALNEVAATQPPKYCKDCIYQAMAGTKTIQDYEICTRKRTIEFVDLVTGPYTREYVNMPCKSERYPEISYVLQDEQPCGHEGKYFKPKEKA